LRADHRAEHRNGDRFRNGGDRKEHVGLTVAYILFKVIAALIALVSFPAVIRLLVRAESTIDGVTLLAAYHTAHNIVVVLVLMPVIGWFTRFVERLLPDRTSPLTRCSNPAVACAVGSICGSVDAA
jgi:hypothetical protein